MIFTGRPSNKTLQGRYLDAPHNLLAVRVIHGSANLWQGCILIDQLIIDPILQRVAYTDNLIFGQTIINDACPWEIHCLTLGRLGRVLTPEPFFVGGQYKNSAFFNSKNFSYGFFGNGKESFKGFDVCEIDSNGLDFFEVVEQVDLLVAHESVF